MPRFRHKNYTFYSHIVANISISKGKKGDCIMSKFDFENDNLDRNNNQENQKDIIDVTASEEDVDHTSQDDSTYHYAGDPYKEENDQFDDGQKKEEEQRRPRYRFQGQTENTNGTNQNSYFDNGQQFYSNIPEEPEKRKGKGKVIGVKVAKIAGTALIFGVVAGVGFAGVSVVKDRFFPSATAKIETTTVQKNDSDGKSDGSTSDTDVSNIVDAVMPAVVSITSKIETSSFYGFGTQESEGAGSGFILAKTDDSLMIATNNHVISDATDLTVGFNDGTTAKATVVGTDTDADLAVISVNIKDLSDDTISKIKVAVLGSSDDLKVGEEVIAIGNALGYGQSVTTGVISAKDREVSFTDGTMTLIQTDAAINPGNSGGVLVNLDGEVVGINNAKLEDTSVEGMGYAIPISTAQVVLTDIMNAETIPEGEGAYLGIIGRTLDSQYSDALGMPNGIYVSQVVEGSPAEKAGIAAGDIITALDGNNVSTMEGLKEKLSIKKANTEVKITLKRANQNGEYEEKTVKVTLGKQSDYEDSTAEESTQTTEQSTQQSDNYGSNPYGDYYGNGNGGYFDPYEYFFR